MLCEYVYSMRRRPELLCVRQRKFYLVIIFDVTGTQQGQLFGEMRAARWLAPKGEESVGNHAQSTQSHGEGGSICSGTCPLSVLAETQ